MICILDWSIKNSHKDMLRKEDIEEKRVFICIKSFHNAQLICKNFGQKMTLANTQQDIFGCQTHIFAISSK